MFLASSVWDFLPLVVVFVSIYFSATSLNSFFLSSQERPIILTRPSPESLLGRSHGWIDIKTGTFAMSEISTVLVHVVITIAIP